MPGEGLNFDLDNWHIMDTIRYMEVVFDSAKDAENFRKHGVSLRRAEDFAMDSAVIRLDDREDYGEVRYNALGFIGAALFALVFTTRGDTIRAISLRKASKKESESYAENF